MSAKRSLVLRVALRFPTTLVVSAPHVLVFLPLAIWNDNPGTDFIVRCGIAVAGTLVVEASVALVVAAERRSGRIAPTASTPDPSTRWEPQRVATIARTVTIISVVANLTSALLGASTLRSEVDGVLPSGAASILTPFVSWAQVALALLVAARFLGGLSRVAVLRWIGVLLLAQIAVASILTITARAVSFLVLLIVLAFLTNLVPRAWIAGGIGVLAVLWPTVYAVRNQLRTAHGIDVDADVSAFHRLRFDEQIVRAAQYGPGHSRPARPVGQPAVRTGTAGPRPRPRRRLVRQPDQRVPRWSRLLRVTFLPVATAWFFWGTFSVVLLYAGCAAAVMALRPWRTIARPPYAVVLLTLMLGGPLAWFSTPPDTTIALLQTLVTILPVFLACTSGRGGRNRRSPETSDDRPRNAPTSWRRRRDRPSVGGWTRSGRARRQRTHERLRSPRGRRRRTDVEHGRHGEVRDRGLGTAPRHGTGPVGRHRSARRRCAEDPLRHGVSGTCVTDRSGRCRRAPGRRHHDGVRGPADRRRRCPRPHGP